MGANSFRERIIIADKTIIEGISAIKTVERKLPSYEDLGNFANTQFPVAAIVGRIPVPDNHIDRRGKSIQVDQIISELSVDIYVYIQENVNADSEISNMLDDFWPALYNDPTRGGLCIFTELLAEEETETWPPYVAFKLIVKHKYQHSTGGI